MSSLSHKLHIHREALKFSAAHMTIFPDGTKERLHGHNYQVALEVEIGNITFNDTLVFATFKEAMKKICDDWDERLLLAIKNPHFKAGEKSTESLNFILCGKTYVIPKDEVVLLPLENITVETLSEHFLQLIRAALPKKVMTSGIIQGMTVRVDQAPGLGGSTTWKAST